MDLIDELRDMADSGMTRKAMCAATGLTTGPLNYMLRQHGIKTKGIPGVAAKPKDEAVSIHGCSGKQPHKLMPSADAVRCASIWSVAGGVLHDQSFEPRQLVRQSVGSFSS